MLKDSKPTIYDPNFLPTNIYSGVPSFLNLPVVEEKEDLKNLDVAVMGVPWEGGCTIGGYSSCTEGPKSIRSASIRYTGYLPDFDIDSFEHLRGGDYGDVPVQNGNYNFIKNSGCSGYNIKMSVCTWIKAPGINCYLHFMLTGFLYI